MSGEHNLIKNLQMLSSQNFPIYKNGHSLETINSNLGELIVAMNANQGLVPYLLFKQRYLSYWLKNELNLLDQKNLDTRNHSRPEYSLIKIKNYQSLEQLFLTLDAKHQSFDKKLLLRKEHYVAFSEPDQFQGLNGCANKIKRAREVEERLLNSFTLNQLGALSYAVYADIRQANQQGKLPGILPPCINNKVFQKPLNQPS